ncbi:MAG: ATP-binding cassette domain-containing protein [Pseudomonadota bacterium]
MEIPSLTIEAGDVLAVTGVSGSGKSTLLDMLGLVLRPTEAEVFEFHPLGGRALDVASLWQANALDQFTEARGRHIGYVLQTGALLPFVNVRENISLSTALLGRPSPGWIEALAGRLGIEEHLNKRPAALSVGQRQRVAIARALAHRPEVIIADEPTAALDPETAARIITLMLELAEETGAAMIFASHDWEMVRRLGLRVLVPEVSGTTSVLRG